MNREGVTQWEITAVRRAGRYHEERGEVCQDSIAYARGNGNTAIVLADGAGSCSRAEDGARIAAEVTAQSLVQVAEELETMEDADVRYHVLMTVRMALDKYCWAEDVYLKDVGSTLLAAVATASKILIIHLGDGWIAQTDEKQKHSILSLPENGRRRNQTYLTSMIPVMEHVRVTRVPLEQVQAVTLFSDGWENASVRYDWEEIETALQTGEVKIPHTDDVSVIRMARKKSNEKKFPQNFDVS